MLIAPSFILLAERGAKSVVVWLAFNPPTPFYKLDAEINQDMVIPNLR
jgi:hypothetical protein